MLGPCPHPVPPGCWVGGTPSLEVLPMAGPRHPPSPLRESEVPLLRVPMCSHLEYKTVFCPGVTSNPVTPPGPAEHPVPGPTPGCPPPAKRVWGAGLVSWISSLGVWLLLVSRGGAVLPRPLPTSVGSKQATRRETSVTLYFQQVSGCWGNGESEQASASHPPRGDVQGQELARGCWMPTAMGGGVAQSRQAWAGPSGTPGPPGERSGRVQ